MPKGAKSPREAYTAINVTVGKVVSIRPHPNAERLRIADVVYSSDGKQAQIVFGGFLEVVTVGSIVPVAPPTKSCRVQGVKMRRRNFRGVTSYGELCSLYELGLIPTDTDQVAIIAQDLEIGTSLVDIIKKLNTYDELWTVFRKPIESKEQVIELANSR